MAEIKPILGPPVVFRTSAGAPASACDVHAQVLSPHHARVEWSTPAAIPSAREDTVDPDLWYEIHWKTEGSFTPNQGVKEHTFIPKMKSSSNQTTQADLVKLVPSQSYSVWVRTHSYNTDVYTDSETVSIQTYPEPNDILATFKGAYVMHVSWLPYNRIRTLEHFIEYTELGLDAWKRVEDEGSQKADSSINYVVQNLLPKTQYRFRLRITYMNNTVPYVWPQDALFIFETLGDRPSPPGKPKIQHLSGSVYQLQWIHSAPHGGPVILYQLFGHAKPSDGEKVRTHREIGTTMESISLRTDVTIEYIERAKREANYSQPQSDLPHFSVEDNSDSMLIEVTDEPLKDGWKMLYNGTDNYWIISELKLSERYTFCVRAYNSYGWSDFSDTSDEFDFSEAEILAVQPNYISSILGISISMGLVLFFMIIWCVFKKRNTKTVLGQSIPLHSNLHGPDEELATLRELPRSRGGGGMFQESVLYNHGMTECDISQLPHIRRDQITLAKFLGSGAFGEVFQGKARGLNGEGSYTRVAVKTLRKGATDQRKTEFLQEAQLMSNFRHEHILRLLGVCLDNDPHFIIMELMEAGDLLSYLRTRRNMLGTNDALTLRDLLSMCHDVTRGCCYLEEMHFVHRDLACRNCLVSLQPTERIVKIGDFGLARDIYKNDYYRKEGEGLLPIRWMAVECLTDGVFSRASDVWAWAVLCWEVAALGRQPYPALHNHAVMRYVRAGGTLSRPPNCPLPLFQLMQKCWSYNPDHRPTFKHCLEILESLMESIDLDVVLTAAMNEEPQYITVIADDDMDFMNDGQHLPEDLNEEVVPEGPPKYLELIYDSDTPPPCIDGYEVPRASIRSNFSRNIFKGDPIHSRNSIERRRSFNRMDNRNSLSRISENRRTSSNPIERRRSFNHNLTSTAQIHTPNGLRVKMLEPNLNGILCHNSIPRPRSSGNFHQNEFQPNTSQKIAPNAILINGVSRNNSVSSRTSDEGRAATQALSEQRRLLSNANCVSGFSVGDIHPELGRNSAQKTIT